MSILKIPTPLRTYTNGQAEVSVNGGTVASALDSLIQQYPAIRPHLFNEAGDLRPFVNLFVGGHNIKDLQGVNTPIADGDKLLLIPSIAGGSCHCEYDVRLSEAISCFLKGLLRCDAFAVTPRNDGVDRR